LNQVRARKLLSFSRRTAYPPKRHLHFLLRTQVHRPCSARFFGDLLSVGTDTGRLPRSAPLLWVLTSFLRSAKRVFPPPHQEKGRGSPSIRGKSGIGIFRFGCSAGPVDLPEAFLCLPPGTVLEPAPTLLGNGGFFLPPIDLVVGNRLLSFQPIAGFPALLKTSTPPSYGPPPSLQVTFPAPPTLLIFLKVSFDDSEARRIP